MANVFVDELNGYFLGRLKDSIYVFDADGVQVPVPVSYHVPEGEGTEDFKDTRITFFFYAMMLDTSRQVQYEPIIVSKDPVTNVVITKEQPIPYKLYYQFDIWSEWNEDIMIILPQFQKLLPPRGDIAVPCADGDIHHLFMELEDMKQVDSRLWEDASKHTDQRFFRSRFRYCVYTELDLDAVKEFKMVRSVEVDAQQNG